MSSFQKKLKLKLINYIKKNSKLNDKLHKAFVTNDDTIISMIDCLRVEISGHLGLCAIL